MKPINKTELAYRLIAGLIGWFAIGLQLYLIMANVINTKTSLFSEAVRFISYFTILCNILVALCLTVPLINPTSRLGRYFLKPVVQGGVAVYIAIVGITYSLMLRHIWNPQGWQLVADRLLHDAMPVIYLLFWLIFVPKGYLKWKHAFSWLLFPAVYLVYILIRGSLIDQYPYPFIDVVQLGYNGMLKNALFMLIAFVVTGLLIVLIDRLLRKNVPALNS